MYCDMGNAQMPVPPEFTFSSKSHLDRLLQALLSCFPDTGDKAYTTFFLLYPGTPSESYHS